VQPGLLFSTKGAKNTGMIAGQSIQQKVKLSYLEVPVNLLYKPVLGKGKLLLGFGPYIAFGLAGKVKTDAAGQTQTSDAKFKNTVKPSDPSDKAYFKPVDAGANLLFGYELSNKLSAQLNAQLGLTKINPGYEGAANDKSTWKNTGFGISFGYRL
jgi:Outer membrane protein beta-barrel domain